MIALHRHSRLSLSRSVRYFSCTIVRAESRAVRINECSARDGLQNIKQIIATKTKVELLNRLSKTGLQNIEATSFVSPRWVPQLADAKEVIEAIRPLSQKGDIRFPVLTPNMKGLDNVIKSQARDIVVFTSATEGFAKANLNATVEQALLNAETVASAALKQGISVIGSVSCIFADPYTGPTSPEDVRRVAQRLLDVGCSTVVLGDTLGLGTPQDTEKLLSYLLQTIPAERLTGHFHDTYGQAVANVRRSYEMGLRSFDCSVAGLGGCPFAPGARGNVATEDVVYMFERSGVKTGIDLDGLCETGQWISEQLGVGYGSRAGVALRRKHKSRSAGTNQPAASQQASESPLRQFEVIEDAGEYRVSRNGTTLKVTLNRPKNGNALTSKMIDGLTKLFKGLENDHSVFHVLLCSEGKFFCTGMDLSKDMDQDRSQDSDALYEKSLELYDAIDKAPQVTIAMIDGQSFGGGVGLSFICDIRLVSKDARWTLSEVKLGVTPAIISKYIVREWGPAFARESMLTGREISPAELRSIGAVHGIANDSRDLSNMVERKLVDLQKCAPQAASICKQLVRAGWKDPEGDRQEKLIRDTFGTMMLPGSEGNHGISQFQQKVKAVDWAAFWAEKAW